MADYDYTVGVQYSSLLIFHDHSFWDLKDGNGWELHGDYTPTYTTAPNKTYECRDDYIHKIPWFAARCDLEKGRFDGEDEVFSTNNCFSSVAPGGYLHHRNPITVNGEFATMACWFKIRENDAKEFYGSDSYHITLWDWDNQDNVHIHIEIRARDDDDPLAECIKIYYDSKLYQVSYPEPILNDTWYYFSYAVDAGSDRFFMNGKKICEITNSRSATDPVIFKNIKIGAHDMFSSGGLNIDEFVIVNDYLTDSQGFLPNRPTIWIRPEMFHLADLSEESNLYYQYGSALRLNYILYSPASKKAPYLTFDYVQGFPIALFRDQSKLPDSAWKGNVRKLELLNPADIAAISTSKFTLVTVVKFIPNNEREYINGCSLYDHILHPIRITRISYWKEPEDGARDMFNKIKWYQNNQIPMSDFRYFNKFDPDKKQWSE